MEGTGGCQQHQGACAVSDHSSCLEGCRARVGEQRSHPGGRQGQKEWKWNSKRKIPLMGSGGMHNSGRKALSLSMTGTAEVFIYLLGHVIVILFAGWVGKWIQRSSEGSAGWRGGWDGLREAPAAVPPPVSPTVCCQSSQHSQPLCQRAPALLSLETKQNMRRSHREILCSCLRRCRFGGDCHCHDCSSFG